MIILKTNKEFCIGPGTNIEGHPLSAQFVYTVRVKPTQKEKFVPIGSVSEA